MADPLTGRLRKMRAEADSPVRYELPVGDETLRLDTAIGQRLRLEFLGEIHCVACGRKTKKSFNQGYCYPCFRDLAQCDGCIVRPELCHYAAGTCREPQWGRDHCIQPHVVYLANSSGVKVGITRATQVPTRWIDQGATQALPIFEVATRLQSGLLEVAFKAHVADRTDWRRMLKGDPEPVDLAAQRDALFAACEAEVAALAASDAGQGLSRLHDAPERRFSYPVSQYPEKVKAQNLDKTPEVEGQLLGIKGQYLILDTGVINVRRHAGYQVHASLTP